MSERFKEPALNTGGRKSRGFESHSLCRQAQVSLVGRLAGGQETPGSIPGSLTEEDWPSGNGTCFENRGLVHQQGFDPSIFRHLTS